jgi:hypothetical protein
LEKKRVMRYLHMGWPSGRIAEAMGRTRNAIMGLVFREKAVGEAMAAKLAQQAIDPKFGRPRPRRKREKPVVIAPNIQTPTLDPPKETLPAVEYDLRSRRLTLMQLGSNQCRFIAGADHSFCGYPQAENSRYCQHHALRCVAQPRRSVA